MREEKERNKNEYLSHIKSEVRHELNLSSSEITDEDAEKRIRDKILNHPILSKYGSREQKAMVRSVFLTIRKDLDVIQPYADDSSVSEIMVNGKDDIFIEKSGELIKLEEGFDSTETLEEVIRRICAAVNREINEMSPIVDARLPDGSRVNAVYKNVALNGPILTIRKFPEKAITMEDLLAGGSLTEEAAHFLKTLVRAGYNIFVSGGTSSGKTTFLNVLSDYIPKKERVVVIEDSAELRIRGMENVVRLEVRSANAQGRGGVDMQDLIKASLRMRPDRIIVGEVRGKEVLDMIQAMNTGHDGSLSTGHGNSVDGMMRRLESMFLQAADFPIEAIRAQIAEGIDIVVHMGRLPGGERRLLEIAEVLPFRGGAGSMIETKKLFSYIPGEGLKKTGEELQNTLKLSLRGEKL